MDKDDFQPVRGCLVIKDGKLMEVTIAEYERLTGTKVIGDKVPLVIVGESE